MDSFRVVAEELTPLLEEVQFPRFSGAMLYEVVQKKFPIAGSFGWLGLEGAQSFACLTLMEEEGLWPDGLLDAMIPKSLVLIGSGVQLLVQVLPQSVFSAGGEHSSVEAWYSTALDIEESLSGVLDSDVHIFAADVVKSFDMVDGDFGLHPQSFGAAWLVLSCLF